MAGIDREHLEFDPAGPIDGDRWAALADRVAGWAERRGIVLRDIIVLLPFAQLLPLARSAFGRQAGWLPRIETTETLARSLGPAARAQPLQLSLDAAADMLTAAHLLENRAGELDMSRRDPRGFARTVAAVVNTAQALLRAAAAVPPEQRQAHWDHARSVLIPLTGPGATERLLARLALEWAALGVEPATDRLFALRPAAWVLLQAGGPDALSLSLLQHAPEGTSCLLIDADPPAQRLFAGAAASPAFALCDGFEHEALGAAAQVIRHLQRGEQPVALIAQDRVLVRRIRALLERTGLALSDETGWTLSTTRAAAQVMTLLRAASDDAGTDALFDWLKSIETWPGLPDFAARASMLESACRRQQIARIEELARLTIAAPLADFAAAVLARLRPLQAAAPRGVAAWLAGLAEVLDASGTLVSLQADDAGRQVLASLRLDAPAAARADWLQAAGPRSLDLDGFVAWVDAVFERATFRPSAAAANPPQVIITPLAQVIWRPFGALVLPGADDTHLGATPPPHPLLADALLPSLGLQDAAARRADEAAAFSHALQIGPATLLRRRLDGRDPLADSPLVERLRLELQQRGADFAPWTDPRESAAVAATPVHLPAPAAPELLPAQLSASAAEALRECPYRFFALHLLRLREDDELEADVEKRDYGNWLHKVLQAFHESRAAPAAREIEMQRLLALGQAEQARQGLGEAEFLPFAASFAAFVPRYIEWLHGRDAAGAAWRESERKLTIPLGELDDIELQGIIDRIDSVSGDGGRAIELIDYKTGSAESLKRKVRQPLEDTQLAFYAALLAPQATQPLQAMYLALDGSHGLEEIPHRDVESSAAALVQGLTGELRRLREGAGMAALGEGRTCEHCEARGLCRRDHWTRELAP